MDFHAGNSLDPPFDIDLKVVRVAAQQRAGDGVLRSGVVRGCDVDRKSPECLKIAVAFQQFADAGAADLQDVSLAQGGRSFDRISEGSAQTGTVIQRDIAAIRATNLDLHRHRAQMGLDLKVDEIKPQITSRFGCDCSQIRL